MIPSILLNMTGHQHRVADLSVAMASHRPYRPALRIDVALEVISENKGVFYDPETVDALFRLKTSEIEKILC